MHLFQVGRGMKRKEKLEKRVTYQKRQKRKKEHLDDSMDSEEISVTVVDV